MSKKILHLLILMLCMTSVLLFLGIATQRWRIHDDWLFVVRLNEMGLFNWALKYYMTWDGRFLFPAFLSYWAIIKTLGFKATMVICSMVMLGISYCMVRLVELKSNLKFKTGQRIVLGVILNFGIWFSLRQLMVDTLYWMTAGIYIWVLLLNFLWLIWLFVKEYTKNKPSLVFYLFTFVISASAQNISVGALFIFFIVLLNNVLNTKASWKDYKPQIWIIIIGVFGLLVSTFSVGSMKQFGDEMVSNYGTSASGGLQPLVIHWFALYKDAFTFFGLVFYFFAASIALLMLSLKGRNGFQLNLRYLVFPKASFKGLISHMYRNMFFYAAFWTLLIYWPTPLLAPRYYIGFYFFLFLHIILLVINNSNSSGSKPKSKTVLIPEIATILILVMSISVYKNTYTNSKLMKEFRHERDLVLEENKGTDKVVSVPSFHDRTAPTVVIQEEISSDTSYIYNLILQDYFKLKNMRESKALKWNELVENKDDIRGLVRKNSSVE